MPEAHISCDYSLYGTPPPPLPPPPPPPRLLGTQADLGAGSVAYRAPEAESQEGPETSACKQVPWRGRLLLQAALDREQVLADPNGRPETDVSSAVCVSVPGPQGGPRPKRTRYNKNQLKVLIEAFEKEPYLDVSTRQELARRIQIPESRIQVRCQFVLCEGGRACLKRKLYTHT